MMKRRGSLGSIEGSHEFDYHSGSFDRASTRSLKPEMEFVGHCP